MSRKKVIVIGGGAGGIMAAGRAAELGAEVLLLEKMERPGKKLLISGNTRCNLTNAPELDDFISMYGDNGKFLYGAFRCFFRADLLLLLHKYGVRTSQEPDGRIFPSSGKSSDVVLALQRYMLDHGAKVLTGKAVLDIEVNDGYVISVRTRDATYDADAVVLATGGASYPQTGSTGDGYKLAFRLGHSIIKLRPALVPLIVKEKELVKKLQGISLRDVRLTSFSCDASAVDIKLLPKHDSGRGIRGRKPREPVMESRSGDIIFTHFGLSGPAVLLMSLAIVEALEKGPVSIAIDLLPEKDLRQLRDELQMHFDTHGGKFIRSIVAEFLPARMAGPLLENAAIPADKRANQASAAERDLIVHSIKSLRLNIAGACPLTEAMVTAGGVSLDEIDPRTMESRLIKCLYFCGEVMDIDADTGGFNLQAAFSTGYLAGESAARAN